MLEMSDILAQGKAVQSRLWGPDPEHAREYIAANAHTLDVGAYHSWLRARAWRDAPAEFVAYPVMRFAEDRTDDGDDLIRSAEGALRDELVSKAVECWEAVWHDAVPSCRVVGEALVFDNLMRDEDGMLVFDERFAGYLSTLGHHGHLRAKSIKEKAKARWKKKEKLWCLWLNSDDLNYPLWARCLLEALWEDIVKPRHEESRKPPRTPTKLLQVWSDGRRCGGEIQGGTIQVSRDKLSLIIPMGDGDTDVLVVGSDGKVVSLRRILSPACLRTLLVLLALYADKGMCADGTFDFGGVNEILGMIYPDRQGSFETNSRNAIESHLMQLSQLKVFAAGDLEMPNPEPLLTEVRERRTKNTVCWKLNFLIVRALLTDYTRVPRAVYQLRDDDVPLGVGVALVVRRNAVRLLERKITVIRHPITEWLNNAGIDPAVGVRKQGRGYWSECMDALLRVALKGELGEMSSAGSDRETIATLTPSPVVLKSYIPLLERAKVCEKIKRRSLRPRRSQS